MLERDRIYVMDCLEGLASLDQRSVDVIVTSPPYNIGTLYNSYTDQKPHGEYIAWLQEIASGCGRVMKDDASFFFIIGGTPANPWIPLEVACAFREIFVLQNMIHWIKSIAIPRECMKIYLDIDRDLMVGRYKPVSGRLHHPDCHEFVFHFTKNGDVPLRNIPAEIPNQGVAAPSRLWHAPGGQGNAWFIPDGQIQETRHPAVFPVRLPKLCIEDHGIGRTTLVLDPFMGIGSTALACLDLGVDFIGFEIDPTYVDIANTRIRDRKSAMKECAIDRNRRGTPPSNRGGIP
jgi:site-specific DNA-methyltransferase (adenine-specific)